MKKKSLLLAAATVLLSAVPALAHHSFSSEFDIHQPVTLQGVVTKVDWVNPHCFIYIDAEDKDGKTTNWAVETGSPNALHRRGVRKADFVVGSVLTVQGYKAKSGLPVAKGGTIKLPDGRDLLVGSSGTGAPRDNADPSEQY